MTLSDEHRKFYEQSLKGICNPGSLIRSSKGEGKLVKGRPVLDNVNPTRVDPVALEGPFEVLGDRDHGIALS